MIISTDVNKNFQRFKMLLCVEKNFDIVYRDFKIMEKRACMFFVDGFIRDESMARLYEGMRKIDKKAYLESAESFSTTSIPYSDIILRDEESILITDVLSGRIIIFVDGFKKAVVVDIRTYPQRLTAEPDKEKVMRGSKDGFTETLIMNAALLRRRIRSGEFRVQHFEIGDISKTDVALCYMGDRIDKKMLKTITDKLNGIKVESLTMNQQTLADKLVKRHWFNPFPKFRYTERVDTACAQILEGDIIIMVDNAPSVMIMPNSIFDMLEEANDFYFPPITGTYLRLTRYLIVIVTTIATPIWLLFLQNPNWIPIGLEFIKVTDPINIPIIFQLLILEIGIDGLRLASLNTPTMMTTSLSMIGGIILGDFAVKTGWFAPESMLYMAFVAIANFSLPSYELSYALKLMRVITLILTALFNLWGFIAGILIMLLSIAFNHTAVGFSYLYPLIPFDWKKLKSKFIRVRK